jgi:long-chain acyl-CoA synthetase
LHIAIHSIMRAAFRISADGMENLPNDPYILCPNHTSFLDPFAVAATLPYWRVRRLHWGGWTALLFETRLRRAFSRVARVLPVDADRAAGASVELASTVLARGESLVWFPEGERSRDGELHSFRPGIGLLVERTGVCVVPVRIEGAFAAWPRGRRWPRLGCITVHFGAALEPDAVLPPEGTHDRHQRAADAIHDALARLH